MEVPQVLHMNGGVGETSYTQNSYFQKSIISLTKSVRYDAIIKLDRNIFADIIRIVDLGCSSGPNTLLVASDIIDAIKLRCSQLYCPFPELQLFLNDLPTNDFNTVFKSLPEFYEPRGQTQGEERNKCFISGTPGSFYGRLFPRKSLHFVHSSTSLHWLSQVPSGLQSGAKVPLNKGKVYISKASPPCVLDAYANQFQKDFSSFLKCRAEEVVVGGRMALTFMGRRSADPSAEENCYQWELLAKALMCMASEGLVKEEEVDTFNVPYYAPSTEEVKHEIEKEGSFYIHHLGMFEASWCASQDHHVDNNKNNNIKDKDLMNDALNGAQLMVKTARACIESMLASHFGENIIEELFRRFCCLSEEYFSNHKSDLTSIVVSMVKGPQKKDY